MKTITIRLADVEAAMLADVQKKPKTNDLSGYIVERIRVEYKQLREK